MEDGGWRRDPGIYPELQTLLLRRSDIDVERHVNNVALLGLFAEARERWLQSRQLANPCAGAPAGRDPDEPLLRCESVETDFIAVTQYPKPPQCGLLLMNLDDSGFTLDAGLFQEGVCVAVQRCRMGGWRVGERAALARRQYQALAPLVSATEASLVDDAAHGGQPFPPLHTPAAPGAASRYPFHDQIAIRYSDRDDDRRLSEAAQCRLIEDMRVRTVEAALRSADLPLIGTALLARLRVAFGAHREAPETVDAHVGVLQLGRSSATVGIALMAGELMLARSDSVVVFVDPATGRPTPMADPLRATLRQRLLVGA